ncbi:hypothetical protein HAALTHF_22980n [Vreelandella aquamarina]|nr:hypothetical protein HAALTHF_22980n [Halomonas axialensis]
MDNPDSKHPADEPVSEGIPAPDGPANLIDTDYVIGQDNITTSAMGFNLDLHGKVFTISSLVVLLFVILTLALQDTISPIYDAVFGFPDRQSGLVLHFGRQYLRHSLPGFDRLSPG